jgi:hypothetical protein
MTRIAGGGGVISEILQPVFQQVQAAAKKQEQAKNAVIDDFGPADAPKPKAPPAAVPISAETPSNADVKKYASESGKLAAAATEYSSINTFVDHMLTVPANATLLKAPTRAMELSGLSWDKLLNHIDDTDKLVGLYQRYGHQMPPEAKQQLFERVLKKSAQDPAAEAFTAYYIAQHPTKEVLDITAAVRGGGALEMLADYPAARDAMAKTLADESVIALAQEGAKHGITLADVIEFQWTGQRSPPNVAEFVRKAAASPDKADDKFAKALLGDKADTFKPSKNEAKLHAEQLLNDTMHNPMEAALKLEPSAYRWQVVGELYAQKATLPVDALAMPGADKAAILGPSIQRAATDRAYAASLLETLQQGDNPAAAQIFAGAMAKDTSLAKTVRDGYDNNPEYNAYLTRVFAEAAKIPLLREELLDTGGPYTKQAMIDATLASGTPGMDHAKDNIAKYTPRMSEPRTIKVGEGPLLEAFDKSGIKREDLEVYYATGKKSHALDKLFDKVASGKASRAEADLALDLVKPAVVAFADHSKSLKGGPGHDEKQWKQHAKDAAALEKKFTNARVVS